MTNATRVASLALLALHLYPAPDNPNVAPPKTAGRIEGRVTSFPEGNTLAEATVRLRRESGLFLLSAPNPNQAAYTVQAGPDGKFTFDDVAPGEYRLYADHSTYLRSFHGVRSHTTPSAGTVIRVSAGQTLTGHNVALPRPGTISGRVENHLREPQAGMYVSALWVSYGEGRRQLLPIAFGTTDKDGKFTLERLFPGRYYVRVDQSDTPRIAGRTANGQRPALTTILRRTYYPDAEEPAAGMSIAIQPGTEARSIDFRLKPGKIVKVHGKVDWGGLNTPATSLTLGLVTKEFDLDATIRPNMAAVQKDGSFTFEEVTPGRYFLEPARGLINPEKYRNVAGRVDVEVRERDDEVADIVFQAVQAPEIKGSIRVVGPARDERASMAIPVNSPAEGINGPGAPPPPPPGQSVAPAPAPAAPEPPAPAAAPMPVADAAPKPTLKNIGIRLVAANRVSVNSPKAVSDADGHFTIASIPLGLYRVDVMNTPEDTYIKEILFNGRDILDSGLDLTTAAGGELSVVLSRGAGEIAGVIRDVKGRAIPGAVVSLWSPDARSGPGNQRALAAIADSSGAFRFTRLSPGKYKAVAWEDIHSGLAEVLDFCQMFASDAQTATIRDAGGLETIHPKAIAPDRIEEATWKLTF